MIALPPDAAPALVSVDVFNAVCARPERNQRESIRNNKHPEAALLRNGYAVCGYCGLHMSAHTSSRDGVAYRCCPKNRDRKGCPAYSTKATLLDSAIWQGVRDRLLDRDLIAAELERLRSVTRPAATSAGLIRACDACTGGSATLMNSLAGRRHADLAADSHRLATTPRRTEGAWRRTCHARPATRELAASPATGRAESRRVDQPRRDESRRSRLCRSAACARSVSGARKCSVPITRRAGKRLCSLVAVHYLRIQPVEVVAGSMRSCGRKM